MIVERAYVKYNGQKIKSERCFNNIYDALNFAFDNIQDKPMFDSLESVHKNEDLASLGPVLSNNLEGAFPHSEVMYDLEIFGVRGRRLCNMLAALKVPHDDGPYYLYILDHGTVCTASAGRPYGTARKLRYDLGSNKYAQMKKENGSNVYVHSVVAALALKKVDNIALQRFIKVNKDGDTEDNCLCVHHIQDSRYEDVTNLAIVTRSAHSAIHSAYKVNDLALSSLNDALIMHSLYMMFQHNELYKITSKDISQYIPSYDNIMYIIPNYIIESI